MITSFFYPTEFKKLTERLRRENNLNSAALANIDRAIQKNLWGSLILGLFFALLFSLEPGAYNSIMGGVLGAAIGYLALHIETRRMCKIAYLLAEGVMTQANITKVEKHRTIAFHHKGWIVHYCFDANGQTVSAISDPISRNILECSSVFGRTLEIAFDQANPARSTPAILQYKQRYQVSLDKAEQA